MTKGTDILNLKRLIDIGKDKGYITYGELNDDLPDEVASSEESVDDIMMMFEDLDIMVIDETAKDEVEKSRKLKKHRDKPDDKENYRIDLSDAGGKGADPVKMYLKEMGCISLLTREGEVEIAKRIEAGEKEALKALIDCSVGIEHIIELGKALNEGELKVKDVINDLDEEDGFTQTGERKASLLALIQQIDANFQECQKARQEMMKPRCTESRKRKLSAEAAKRQEDVRGLVDAFRLEKRQLELMVRRLEQSVKEVEAAEKQVADCMLFAGGKPISYLKRCFAQIPKAEGDESHPAHWHTQAGGGQAQREAGSRPRRHPGRARADESDTAKAQGDPQTGGAEPGTGKTRQERADRGQPQAGGEHCQEVH